MFKIEQSWTQTVLAHFNFSILSFVWNKVQQKNQFWIIYLSKNIHPTMNKKVAYDSVKKKLIVYDSLMYDTLKKIKKWQKLKKKVKLFMEFI